MTYRPHPVRLSIARIRAAAARRRGLAPYVLLGILAAFAVAAPASASPPLSQKQAEANRVYAQVQQLDSALGQADERLNLANYRLNQVQHDIVENGRALVVAKANLKKSRDAIAQRLVTLYTAGDSSSTLEVLIGAKSLDEVLSQLDTANKVSNLDAQVINQVQTFQAAVKHHATVLRVERSQVKHLVAQRAAQQRAAASKLNERRRLLNSLNGEIARLVAQARARELLAAQRARAAYNANASTLPSSVIGATATAAEGETILPSSNYGGVVGVAMQYLGTPYVWAGAAPGGFDCSGLVSYAYAQLGVALPHSSYAMWGYGTAVPRDQLQPGDLVFFEGLGHVGIYIGGDQFVHAPHTGDVVKISSLDEAYYAASYVGARRII